MAKLMQRLNDGIPETRKMSIFLTSSRSDGQKYHQRQINSLVSHDECYEGYITLSF